MPHYTYTNDDESAVKNKLGARTHEQLEKREAKFVSARDTEITLGFGPRGTFDAAHLKAIHYHLFRDVYEWAGHTRDEHAELSDGTFASEPMMRKRDGKAFLIGPKISAALDRIASRIRNGNYLRDLPREEFARRAADVMADINGVHAFREGNGRAQRTFMKQLAKQAGHRIEFSVISRERMIQASIAANEHGDPGMMRRHWRGDRRESSRCSEFKPQLSVISPLVV